MVKNIPMDYPRPQLYREAWLDLNGKWQFDFDDDDVGVAGKWYGRELSRTIEVPFCYQCEKSTVNDKAYHPIVWYRRTFTADAACGTRTLLRFQAVDYAFDLWVNGTHAGSHVGGSTAAHFDITEYITPGENTLALRVTDYTAWHKPQGKQTPNGVVDRCWYTPVTGIWLPVWLETVPSAYIADVRLTPDIDRREVRADIHTCGIGENAVLTADVSFRGQHITSLTQTAKEYFTATISFAETDYVDELHYWTPEKPNLFDVILTLRDGDAADEVQTYFGMRKISAQGSEIYLNNKPYYLRMVLDQGYWNGSLLTPPDGEAIRYDVEMTKRFGFNGARKHQKIEDDRYYYWADKLGLAVTGEMPSPYRFSAEEIKAVTDEWQRAVAMLYNHPSVIGWVPLNESWGVRNILRDKAQQNFAVALYYLTKSLDGTRLVSTNDGWEQVTSDVCAIHDYFGTADEFRAKYADMGSVLERDAQGRKLYADGFAYAGEPIIMSEYGGIAMSGRNYSDGGEWGYNAAAADTAALLRRIGETTGAIRSHPAFSGFCYTQLTDVMQEINGLMDYDHVPKADPEEIAKSIGK